MPSSKDPKVKLPSRVKLKPFTVPGWIQIIFITAAIAVMSYTLYGAVEYTQYLQQSDSSFLWMQLFGMISPIIYFAIALVLTPLNRTFSQKIFESMLLAVIGYMFQIAVQSTIYKYIQITSANYFEYFNSAQFSQFIISIAAYTALLSFMRLTKRWQ
jgi:hypothetical protein